jgi:hypothetical protein
MAIQLHLSGDDAPFKLDFPSAYVRITGVNINYHAEEVAITAVAWKDKAARDAGDQPIKALPVLTIGKEKKDADWQILGDQRTGKPILDGEGRPQLVMVNPPVPAYDEFVADVKEAIVADGDERKVGYELLKKLDLIARNEPKDV